MQITVPTWLWAAVLVAPALITAGVALWSQRMANNREKDQHNHQLDLERMKLEAASKQAREQRLHDDRIKAYLDFVRLTKEYDATAPAAATEIRETHSAIEILGGSPESKQAAKLLYDRIIELSDIASDSKTRWAEQGGELTSGPGYKEAAEAVANAREDFVKTVSKELEGKSFKNSQ